MVRCGISDDLLPFLVGFACAVILGDVETLHSFMDTSDPGHFGTKTLQQVSAQFGPKTARP